MAAVDKFGAAFAIGFMAVMLVIMMGGLTPDGSFSGTSESETSMPTPTYSPPVQSTPPETVTTPSERESLTGFLQYTIRNLNYYKYVVIKIVKNLFALHNKTMYDRN